jgi:hypothetical protein
MSKEAFLAELDLLDAADTRRLEDIKTIKIMPTVITTLVILKLISCVVKLSSTSCLNCSLNRNIKTIVYISSTAIQNKKIKKELT